MQPSPLFLIVLPPMLIFRARFGSSPPWGGFLTPWFVFENLILGDNLVDQLHAYYCNIVLEGKSIVAALAERPFGLRVLVTLLDSHPLTFTHFESALPPQTAFQDPSWLVFMSMSLRRVALLKVTKMPSPHS